MRVTQKTLDKLPTKRLYYGRHSYYTVPYMNANKNVRIPVKEPHFKENGQGLPFGCGVSNAVMEAGAEQLSHPVYYVHTIGSVVYVTVMVTKGRQPRLLLRYRHRSGKLVDAYDETRKNKRKMAAFKRQLKLTPFLILEKARHEGKAGAHSPGAASGHRDPDAPHGDLNKKHLAGHLRRMIKAGFVPEGMPVK